MQAKDCVHCGETVVVADRGEQITDGETPVEHMERTGHAHIHEPVLTGCHHCGHLWMYQGAREQATCPSCKSKTPAGTMDDSYPEAEQ